MDQVNKTVFLLVFMTSLTQVAGFTSGTQAYSTNYAWALGSTMVYQSPTTVQGPTWTTVRRGATKPNVHQAPTWTTVGVTTPNVPQHQQARSTTTTSTQAYISEGSKVTGRNSSTFPLSDTQFQNGTETVEVDKNLFLILGSTLGGTLLLATVLLIVICCCCWPCCCCGDQNRKQRRKVAPTEPWEYKDV